MKMVTDTDSAMEDAKTSPTDEMEEEKTLTTNAGSNNSLETKVTVTIQHWKDGWKAASFQLSLPAHADGCVDCRETFAKIEALIGTRLVMGYFDGHRYIPAKQENARIPIPEGGHVVLYVAPAGRGGRANERKIYDVIKLLTLWKSYYTNGVTKNDGTRERVTMGRAAEYVGVSRKTLDDYMEQVRKAKSQGFDFSSHAQDKMGTLRAFVKRR